MDRVEISTEYATTCQQVIDDCGEDYKKGSERIMAIAVPEGLHSILVPISYFTYDIVGHYSDEEDGKYYWELIKTKIERFLANEWEPTTWWAMIMYGLEEDGLLKYPYSLSIRRQGGEMIYESGNDELVDVAQAAASSIDPQQTDEWFMHALLQKLPKVTDELILQSSRLNEVTSTEWDSV